MPVIRAILFSSGFHLLALLLVVWLAPYFEPKKTETIQIELYPEGRILEALTPPKEKRQVVRNALTPPKIQVPEDETLARFLSENKQRVRVESQAAQSGMTANRDNIPGDNKPVRAAPVPTPKTAPNKTTAAMEKDGYKVVDIRQELDEMNRAGQGFSTIGESLPRDVKVGSFTALNTDRYLFYTFYARVEELVRYRWETRVQYAMERLDPRALPRGNSTWETQVEFLLDKDGYLKKARVMKLSGIPAFDATGVDAFQEARVFPNPPPEMVQDDGFIHLRFSFTVNYNPAWVVRREN